MKSIPKMQSCLQHSHVDPKLRMVDMMAVRLVNEAPYAVDPAQVLETIRQWAEALLHEVEKRDGVEEKVAALAAVHGEGQ